MSENPQELVEAQLLAYVEGELDDAGRAEIERHLEANPKHRQLLADLEVGRKWVRGLRREAAPTELFDGVQSQLERHLLLDVAQFPKVSVSGSTASATPTDDGQNDSSLRIHRRARLRFAAAAAVVLGGIGVVIYSSLPPRQTNIAEGPGPFHAPMEPTGDGTSQPTPGVAPGQVPADGARSPESSDTARNGSPGDLSPVVAPVRIAPPGAPRARGMAQDSAGGAGSIEKQSGSTGTPSPRGPQDMAQLARLTRAAPEVRQAIDQLRREKDQEPRRPMAMAKAAAPTPTPDASVPSQPEAMGSNHVKDERSEGGASLARKSDPTGGVNQASADAAKNERNVPPAGRPEPLVLVIASADPDLARLQVAEALKDQNLTFRQVTLSDPSPGHQSAEDRNRSQRPAEPLSEDRPVPAATAPPAAAAPATPAPMRTQSDSATPAGDAPAAGIEPAPTVPRAAPSPAMPAAPSAAPIMPAKPGFDANTRPALAGAQSRPSVAMSNSAGRNAMVVVRVPRNRADKLLSQLSRTHTTQYLLASNDESAKKEMNSSRDADVRSTTAQTPTASTQPTTASSLPTSTDKAASTMSDSVRRATDPVRQEQPFSGASGQPMGAPSLPASKPATQSARADDKIHPGDTIQLARSLRPGGPPVVLRLTVAEDGTIFVLGVGNVAISGLTSEAASDLLTQKLREKLPSATRADIRRLTDVPPVTSIARGAGGGGGGGPNFKRDGLRSENGVPAEPTAPSRKGGVQADAGQRPVTSPANAPTGGVLQQAQAERETVDARGDELIDLVIVVESPTGK